ncbi:AraC family transcriptional regulator [Cohnella ginsengisoli]|uniref:AraC family transcriptional regulator n=1 Tax=Cohnella ginsengisoli TaxID=425004 RepID=A0A9X4KK26_9BACL|nr:AraC family transcriptional regulator [Cohnella ginsengisoli]MDG0791310.1 AraC family transcriptional regulator [Cohnella ginsengisoli]
MLAWLRESQLWCESHLRVSFSCFVGETAVGVDEIPSTYRTLQQLSQYRFIYGFGTIVRQADIDESAREDGKISAMEETELMDALNNGQLNEAKEIFRQMMDRQKKLKYESMMTNMLQIAYIIHNRMANMEDYGDSDAPININQSLKELLDAETADEWRLSLEQSFARMTKLVKERKEKRSSALADSAVSYIHLHYRDASLCLDTIAEHLKYSKVYLSKVFRETVGHSVAEYITDYRISKVVEDLGSGCSIDELLERNGVDNKKYFYTLFKRKMGVSIREYRTITIMQQPVSEDKN